MILPLIFWLKNLWDENIGTKNNLGAAFTQYSISKTLHTAQSQLAETQTDLNNYFIRSESNGTVFQTYKERWETSKPNDIVALLGESANQIIKLVITRKT